MKKISAFITTGVENVIPVLKAVNAAADAFPPLKSAVGGALWIHNAYTEFKSNQEEWKAFGEYVAQAVACVSADVSRSGNPAQFDHALKTLASTLDEVVSDMKKVPELQATNSIVRRAVSFLKDRDKISALEKKLSRCLSNFNLGTTIDARNELAKIFANTEGLVAGVSILAANVKRLDESSTLRQLKVADGSSWNRQKMCQEGTRSDLLEKLEHFASARDPLSPERVFLLTGVAGCGKTAIAQSLAERLSKQKWPSPRLGACFNFSAQVEDRRTTKLLFSTIAFFLSAVDQSLEASIVDALSSDRTLSSATLTDQFDGLIRLPLSTLPVSPPRPIVLILDALDEISDSAGLEALLSLLATDFSRLPASCRVIITSRPNPSILRPLRSANQHHIVWQHMEQNDVASLRDLSLVARTRLREIAARRNLEDSWPERELEERFVRKAGGLFVWVDVACKAIDAGARYGERIDARARLANEMHRLLAGDDTEADLDTLYLRILDGCPWHRKAFSCNYHLVLGTVVALRTPLSASAINQLIGPLLNKGVGDVEDVLEPLASVMLGLSTLASPSFTRAVEISHESFREFVTIAVPEDKQKYAINELEASQRLALQCLSVLNNELPLHADMLLKFFADTDEERAIPSPEDGVVSEALGYACDHWMGHLSVVTTPTPELVNAIRHFLSSNLIPWMELCACRGQFHGADILQTWLSQHHSYIEIDFASEVDLDNLAQCLEALYDGLEYMQRLEEALAACQLWVSVERQLIDRVPERLTNALARSLNTVSNRLSRLGRRDEALVAIEEAVEICRALATDRPADFNPVLASSLNNLSNRLSGLGHREEALVAIEEAVRIHRQLANDQPTASNPDLAASLTSLSSRLSDLGRREEALLVIEEAVRILRQLAIEDPATFNPDLALSLTNHSVYLSNFGRQEEALAAIEEAVRIHRQLANDQPAASNPDLAASLTNLSNHLSDTGRREEALVTIEEAVRICRALATDRPAAFHPDLAISLTNLSIRLSDLGQQEEGLLVIEEAVRIFRQLAIEHPATFNPDLAASLSILSTRLSDLGRREEALVAIEESVRIRRALATEHPAAFNPNLAMSLNSLSVYLYQLGRREEALIAIEEAIRIYRQLATKQPAAFNPDLARALNNLAWELHKSGTSGGEAIMAARESIAIYRQKAAKRPVALRRSLARSLDTLACCLSDVGHHEEAVASIQEAVEIQRQLVEEQPEPFTPKLADFLKTMAGCIFKEGDAQGALGPIAEAVALYRPLALKYPIRFKPELAEALERQADYFMALGKDAEAELACAERATLI